MKLNVGCGRNIITGWVNLDVVDLPGVDVVFDLNQRLVTHGETYDEFLLSHVIEHFTRPLVAMETLWDWAKPDAKLTIRCPHGASDDADEDPTHVRRMFPGSFGYFGQPYYWRADYGYRGDWKVDSVVLYSVAPNISLHTVNTFRNTIKEMVVVMHAVKPRREPLRELQNYVEPQVVYVP